MFLSFLTVLNGHRRRFDCFVFRKNCNKSTHQSVLDKKSRKTGFQEGNTIKRTTLMEKPSAFHANSHQFQQQKLVKTYSGS